MNGGVESLDDGLGLFGVDWSQVHASVVQRLRELSAVSAGGVPAVAEVYSPPRVIELAQQFGLRRGFALDLTNGWDFTLASDRARALKLLRRDRPVLLIGSPPCTVWSTLQNLMLTSVRLAILRR